MGLAKKVVRPSQMAFMLGQNIIEGVVILHKISHGLYTKKLNWVVLKFDFEKA